MANDNSTIDINGIECSIFVGEDGQQGGIQESYSLETGPEARVTFKCGWADRQPLIQALLGTVSYKNGSISRTPPFAYPLDQSLSSAGGSGGTPPAIQIQNRWVCTSTGPVTGIKWKTDIDGSETGTGLEGWGFYAWAVFDAVFTVPLWQPTGVGSPGSLADPTGNSYVITKIRTSGEVFAPPTGAIIYGGGKFAGKALQDVNGSLLRTRSEISITLVRMPIIPTIDFDSLIGSVNEADFEIGAYSFPMGSMLFTGWNSEPHPDPCNFGIVQDIELLFLGNGPASSFQGGGAGQSSLDWNYFLDPSGTFVVCNFNTDPPTPIFAYTDFTTFFENQLS
jgi:hypothetical protein